MLSARFLAGAEGPLTFLTRTTATPIARSTRKIKRTIFSQLQGRSPATFADSPFTNTWNSFSR